MKNIFTMRFNNKVLIIMPSFLALASCGDNFLDVKRDARQVVPASIADYQAVLDRHSIMNAQASVGLGLIGAGEFMVSDDVYNAISSSNPVEALAYTWSPKLFIEHESRDWNNAYQRILHANLAMDVEKIQPADDEKGAWQNVKGSALFFR